MTLLLISRYLVALAKISLSYAIAQLSVSLACFISRDVQFLDRIVLAAQAIPPSHTHFSVARSVRLSSATFAFPHLLKPFDGFRCHLASTNVEFSDMVLDGVPDPQEKRIFGGRTPSQSM